MNYKKTTYVPNEVFDIYLPDLTFSELKILLYIIRQTYGWKLKNGKRKQRDRITHSLFHQKTGISRRAIPGAIQSLIIKQLILVTNAKGIKLHLPEQRKGKVSIYYTPCFARYAETTQKVCTKQHQPMQKRGYNKTKTTKLIGQKQFEQKGRVSDKERLQQILNSMSM